MDRPTVGSVQILRGNALALAPTAWPTRPTASCPSGSSPASSQTVADTLKTFLDALAGGSWPTDARSAVDDVMASVGAQMNAAQQCAKGKTIADFNTAWDYTDPKPGSAQVLRAKLGLPAAG